MEPTADIAVIGLAVMGQNLILNMNDHGFVVAAFNRTTSKVDEFLNDAAKGTRVIGAHSLAEMAGLLKRPRRVMLMVKAGKPVDEFIEHLLPHLEAGDIIIDGGNSLFEDTTRRTKYVESKGLLYIGTGVSGGEEGARRGPSIMPGGSPAAWPHVKDIFQTIAAKVEGGVPCCDWVGENGAGHYVKMVHNGIEYGDMQLICEAYNLMKTGLGMSADEMHEVFAEWNRRRAQHLPHRDHPRHPRLQGHRRHSRWWTRSSTPPGQKGTGKWTVNSSQELGIPITLIAEAVYRALHFRAQGGARGRRPKLKGPRPAIRGDRARHSSRTFASALYASKIMLLRPGLHAACARPAKEYGWNLNYGGIALMWRGGCIIRSCSWARSRRPSTRTRT